MANRNRTAGIKAELEIAKELRELGFDKIVSTRFESKRMDDAGVDLIQLPHPNVPLPCYVQVKKTINTPSEELLKVELEKPLVIVHQKQVKKGSRFYTDDQYVMMKKDFFYKLLKYVHTQLSTVSNTEKRSD